MSGLQLKLDLAFTDTTLPVLQDDPLLTNGSLVLVDLAHPANPAGAINASSGIPGNGAVLNNIAFAQAATLLGTGSQASLSGALRIAGGIADGVKGKVERTAKGGLHGIVSKANALADGDGMSFNVAQAIRNYIASNTGHAFYVSVWDRMTRLGTGGITWHMLHDMTSNGDAAGFNLASLRSSEAQWTEPGGPVTRYNTKPDVNGTLGSHYASGLITKGRYESAANAAQFGAIWGSPTGSYNNAVRGTRNGTWASFAHYRFYLEDLTVSGRSFDTVDALDYANYQRQVLTAGGRYYNDSTPTQPSAIA